MSDTIVQLECSGGWGPLLQTALVTLGQLPTNELQEMESLLQQVDFDALKSTNKHDVNSPMRDGRKLKLEVRHGGELRSFEFGDRNIPPALLPLVQTMSKRLKATTPK